MNKGIVLAAESPIRGRRFGFARGSLVAFVVLAIASWGFILLVDGGDVLGLFSGET